MGILESINAFLPGYERFFYDPSSKKLGKIEREWMNWGHYFFRRMWGYETETNLVPALTEAYQVSIAQGTTAMQFSEALATIFRVNELYTRLNTPNSSYVLLNKPSESFQARFRYEVKHEGDDFKIQVINVSFEQGNEVSKRVYRITIQKEEAGSLRVTNPWPEFRLKTEETGASLGGRVTDINKAICNYAESKEVVDVNNVLKKITNGACVPLTYHTIYTVEAPKSSFSTRKDPFEWERLAMQKLGWVFVIRKEQGLDFAGTCYQLNPSAAVTQDLNLKHVVQALIPRAL